MCRLAACTVDVQAWGCNDNELIGYVILNGVEAQNTNWASSDIYIGFNLAVLDNETCTMRDFITYNTYSYSSEAEAMAEYLEAQPAGIVVVGVTANDAYEYLSALYSR